MTPPARGKPSARLSRAAALATIATVGSVGPIAELTACSSDSASSSPTTTTDAAPAEAEIDNTPDAAPDVVMGEAAYGVVQFPDVNAPEVLTAGDAYGGPDVGTPQPDTGPDVVTDGGPDASDAAPDVITGGDAYGVAPHEGGGPGSE